MTQEPKKVIRCSGPLCNHENGNILLAFDKNRIYVKCRNRDCKRWTRITLKIPGLCIDLADAGIVQEVLPEDYHLHLENATVVVSDDIS
jgi:hypothetical protein